MSPKNHFEEIKNAIKTARPQQFEKLVEQKKLSGFDIDCQQDVFNPHTKLSGKRSLLMHVTICGNLDSVTILLKYK